jgi:hypothetical protein
MSITVSNTSINYGGISTITVNDLLNVSISPSNSVTNTEYSNSGTVIYTVQPTISTLYYITGYNTLNNQINLNTTIYVNVTLLNNIIEIPYNTSQEINVYGSSSYSWSPSLYLNNNNSSSVTCTPLENIVYTIIGKDPFNTISRTYLKIVVNNGLTFTPSNPTVYEGNLLILSVNFDVNFNVDNTNSNSGNISNLSYNYDTYEEDDTNNYIWTFINGVPILSVTSSNENKINKAQEYNNISVSVSSTIYDTSTITYVWKSKLFDTLPPNCVYYKYGQTLKLHPYKSEEYNVKVYQSCDILTSGNIKINVIEKPMNIIDIDILPYAIYQPVITRDKKTLIKLLKENKPLSMKIIKFYYNILLTAYRMEWTNKTGISYSIKWNTVYQVVNDSNEMILNFNQQWRFFQYINYHQTRNNITTSNFAYLLNVVNEIYLEHPQKIGIYPLLS